MDTRVAKTYVQLFTNLFFILQNFPNKHVLLLKLKTKKISEGKEAIIEWLGNLFFLIKKKNHSSSPRLMDIVHFCLMCNASILPHSQLPLPTKMVTLSGGFFL